MPSQRRPSHEVHDGVRVRKKTDEKARFFLFFYVIRGLAAPAWRSRYSNGTMSDSENCTIEGGLAVKLLPIIVTTLLVTSQNSIADDMSGSADHPLIPRVSGSEIFGYEHSGYDAASFVTSAEGGKLQLDQPEGDRTRILYLAKPGDSPLMVQKNYEVALNELGDVEEVFTCRDKACPGQPFATVLWNKDIVPETHKLKQPFYLLGFSHVVTTPTYRYARVVRDSAQYHVGVFAAGISDNNANADVRGLTAVLVEVLEVEDFEATLQFIDAAEMKSQIDDAGHVALYGIHFDSNKDTLRAESDTTIKEVVKVLQESGDLSIYVVGHTDGVGALAYNQDLSMRRAQTVVKALIGRGIGGDRLTPLGVGPAAPIASNDSEEGRGLNRRVELVKRE